MAGEHKPLATQWTWEGLTSEAIEETATWIGEPRRLGSGCENFFHMAGKMLLLARFDYFLITPVLFYSVIGLERALRVHYKSPDQPYTSTCAGSSKPFRLLFQRVVDDELITDELFDEIPPISELFRLFEKDIEVPSSHSASLALLIPELRNQYFHGYDLLLPHSFGLTIQLRKCADILKTRGTKSLLE